MIERESRVLTDQARQLAALVAFDDDRPLTGFELGSHGRDRKWRQHRDNDGVGL